MGKPPAWSAGLASAAVNGPLLLGQRHLIAQRPELAPQEYPGTAKSLSWSQTRTYIQKLGLLVCLAQSSQLWPLCGSPKVRKIERLLRGMAEGSLTMTLWVFSGMAQESKLLTGEATVSVFGKPLLQWKAGDPPLICSQVLEKQCTHSKAVVDWNGGQGSGLCLDSATLKLGDPTIQLS